MVFLVIFQIVFQSIRKYKFIVSFFILLSAHVVTANSTSVSTISTPIPITFWHSMAGQLGVEVNALAQAFNQSQHQYQVIPVYKGSYSQTLMSLVAAFRAQQQPDIAQVYEVGTAMMANPPGAIIPVYKLMQDANIQLNTQEFLPAVASYYSNDQGKLLALPFNSSTPVLFYNKDAFIKAGLNPNQPPQTWPQLRQDSLKLIRAGYPCGFTTGWPSWIQLEAFSAWHNIPFASENNGFSGVNVKLLYNNSVVIKQINRLSQWQKSRIFVYGGREDDADALFTSAQCPIIMESSGCLADLIQDTNFSVGVGPIPYLPSIQEAPQNMLIGGAALWAMSGHSAAVDKGIAEFFKFLAQPQNQAQWQQATGYLPVTKQAFELSKKQGYYRRYPGALVAVQELLRKQPTLYSQGIRLGAYPQIRDINDQALEAVFGGQETAQQALNQAVNTGNVVLKQFANNVQ